MLDNPDRPDDPRVTEPITLRNLLDYTLREFIDMDGIEDIDINRPQEVWVQYIGGQWQSFERPHLTMSQLRMIAQEVATAAGTVFNEDQEPLTTKLSNGSRIEIVMLPSVISGIALSIRKRLERYFTLADFSFSDEQISFIQNEVERGKTFLISGGTSSGKTTVMENMCDFIPMDTRIINVQDPMEIELPQPNRVDWEVKGNSFDEVEHSLELFSKTAMRLNPDVIIYGEIREKIMAASFAKVLNTGHDGSMATIHADSPDLAIDRLSKLIHQQEGGNLEYIRDDMINQLDYVIHLKKNREGKRVGEIKSF